MPRPSERRTFVYLGPQERAFLAVLQRAVQKRVGLKKPPPLTRIIQGVLMDYRQVIEGGSNPDLWSAYEETRQRKRKLDVS